MEVDPDPVIKEMPVFLAKGLANKLFIFQYPLKPNRNGYNDATFSRTKIKPDNQEVEIEVALDTDSNNYDHSKGKHIAANIISSTKRDEDEEKIFDSDIMDKIVLRSSRALPTCSSYGICIVQDGELHITPLEGIIQMRPQFNYLDKDNRKSKDDTKPVGEEEHEEEEVVKQVNVQFARNVPDHLKKMREQSFQQHTQKSSEEHWVETTYHSASSSQAELTRLEMFCATSDESSTGLNISKKQYLDLLAPVMKEESYCKTNIPNHSSSLNYIRTLPLLDQVRILIKDAKVLSFTQLRSILSSNHDTDSVLRYLQQVAVLVKGNWIVNSELLYPKDTISSHSGIPAELMCRARDYVLWFFTKNEYLDRKAISLVIKLPTEEIREILINLAKHEPKKGWKLIVPENKDFAERYPEVAHRQKLFWDAKEKHFQQTLGNQNHKPQRQRRRSNRESVGSESEDVKICRSKKSLRDSSVSDTDSSTDTVKHKKCSRSRKTSETT